MPSDEDLRRIGWGKAYDTISGCYYYFTLDRAKTVWENPLSSIQDVDVRDHHYYDQRDGSGEATKRIRKRRRKRKTSSRAGSHDDETRASGGEKLVELELHEFGRYSRGRSRDRSADLQNNGQRNMSSASRRSGGYYYSSESYSYEPRGRRSSRSCGPHSRYPSSSRDDHYCHQEYHRESKYPSHFRKRWRSPDSTRQNVEQNNGVNRSRRQKSIGEDLQHDTRSDERRPLGSIHGSEMPRALSLPTKSSDDVETRASGGVKLVLSSSSSLSRGRSRDYSSRSNSYARQRSQSCGPHSRNPSSSRDDHYYNHERNSSLHQHGGSNQCASHHESAQEEVEAKRQREARQREAVSKLLRPLTHDETQIVKNAIYGIGPRKKY